MVITKYSKTDIPRKSKDDPNFSVDVIVSLDGILNIGYYDYVGVKWRFHTNTFISLEEVESFIWIYRPVELNKTS